MSELLTGYVATGAGRTELKLALTDDTATLTFYSRWMGDREPFVLEVALRRQATGSHSGALIVESAKQGDRAVPLPPSDGPIIVEYARMPQPQPEGISGSDTMYAAGYRTSDWTCLLWLHPDSHFDDGTQLPPEEYEHPPSELAPLVKVLKELEHPWKLGG